MGDAVHALSLTVMPRRSVVLGAKTVVFTAVALVVSLVISFVSFFLGQRRRLRPAAHRRDDHGGDGRDPPGLGQSLNGAA